jgi:hypothetical protein
MAFDLTISPVPELLLLLGGLIALIIAIVGKNKKTTMDNVAVFLGFFIGIFTVIKAILLCNSGNLIGSAI